MPAGPKTIAGRAIVAHNVLSAFLLAALNQADHSVDVSKIVTRLRDLGLVGSYDAAELAALLLQCLNKKWIGHAALKPKSACRHQPPKWCACSIMPEELVAQAAVEAFDEAVLHRLARARCNASRRRSPAANAGSPST